MKCHICRDNDAELLTFWERVRYWLFVKINSVFFTQNYDDLKNDRYTQGFSDGTAQGFERGTARAQLDYERYRQQAPRQETKQDISALLTVIDENQVLSITKTGVVYIGNIRADDGRLANLKAEAEFFMSSDLWKVLNQSVRELAQRAMFVAGDSIDDMKKGRAMLYLLDTQNRIVDTLKSYQQKKA